MEIDEFLPFKDPYCQGDSFIIVSNIYQPINFPDIEHLWESAPGGLTSDTLYNMVVIALESGDFTRITTTELVLILLVPMLKLLSRSFQSYQKIRLSVLEKVLSLQQSVQIV
jgi:hypothetical protein